MKQNYSSDITVDEVELALGTVDEVELRLIALWMK